MLNLYFYATEWDNVLFLLTLVSKNINLLRTEKSLLVLIKAKHLLLSWALNVLLYFETVAKEGTIGLLPAACPSPQPVVSASLQILSGERKRDIALPSKEDLATSPPC